MAFLENYGSCVERRHFTERLLLCVSVTLLLISKAKEERGQEVLSAGITFRALVLVISRCDNKIP